MAQLLRILFLLEILRLIHYNNDASNNKYGKLYTWYAVSPITNGNKNICPFGWHVPTKTEYEELSSYLGSNSNIVSKKMKQTGIIDWSLDASNSSLFSALPSGFMNARGYSYEINNYSFWWTSTEKNQDNNFQIGRAHVFLVSRGSAGLSDWDYYTSWYREQFKNNGLSIRCIKD